MIGFGGVVAVLLSLFSGYGLLFIIGTPFTSITQLLTFVIFGIGLDDAIIIFGSYCRTNPKESIETRMFTVVEDVGISITLTSVTSSLAFGLGCMWSIPAVYWLCLYAFPTVIFVYLYQLTFFIACIVLHDHRVRARQHRESSISDAPDRDTSGIDHTSTEEKGGALDIFMIHYAKILLKPAVRVGVILAFVALAVVCAVSASQLVQAFEVTEILPDDSYVTAWVNAYDEYASNTLVNAFVYFREVDQSNETIQDHMESYVNDLVEVEYIKRQPKFFWLRHFRLFVKLSQENVTELPFHEQLELFLSDPIYNYLYKDHIVRNDNGNITASRVELFYDNFDVNDVSDLIDMVLDQRDVTARQPINRGLKDWKFFNYNMRFYLGEFFHRTKKELVITSIIGVTAVSTVAVLFIPHWTAACFILPVICLLYVDLLGVLQWAKIDVNAVTYVTVVMAIGLYVDFIMHVLLRYYECDGNRGERTVEMLRTMGSSVLAGGISTFLGILPLALSTSAVFYTVFIAFVGLVTLGTGHGLIFMPALLATVGPQDAVADISNKKHSTHADTPGDHTNTCSSHHENLRDETERLEQIKSLSVVPVVLQIGRPEDAVIKERNDADQCNEADGDTDTSYTSSSYDKNICGEAEIDEQILDTVNSEEIAEKNDTQTLSFANFAIEPMNTSSSHCEHRNDETELDERMESLTVALDKGSPEVNERNETQEFREADEGCGELNTCISESENEQSAAEIAEFMSSPVSLENAVITDKENEPGETMVVEKTESLLTYVARDTVHPDVNERNEARSSSEADGGCGEINTFIAERENEQSAAEVVEQNGFLSSPVTMETVDHEAIERNKVQLYNKTDGGYDETNTSTSNGENGLIEREVLDQKESVSTGANERKETTPSDQASLSGDDNGHVEKGEMQQLELFPSPVISLSDDQENGDVNKMHDRDSSHNPKYKFAVEESLDDEPI